MAVKETVSGMTSDELRSELISAILELTEDEAAEVLRELKAKGLIKGAAT